MVPPASRSGFHPASRHDASHVDPLERILRVYDRAIQACERGDQVGALSSVRLLRAALELDTPAAKGFDAIYGWCEEAILAQDLTAPVKTLRTLQSAWFAATAPGPSPRFAPRLVS